MLRVPTWSIVLIGLLFNISAALVTHFIIDDKNGQLEKIAVKITANSKEIDLLWLQIEGIERKREMLYLLLNQGSVNVQIEKQLGHLLEAYLQQKVSQVSFPNLAKIDSKIGDYQQSLRKEIDNKFLLNLELSEQATLLRKRVSMLRNWSIFLQMIGLSLILARDLSRKR